ncbi:hypothetical protein, partial [Marinobacter sediminum]|uniref:hypothetical protein n=1 Tax=Marinobacter sediminum TaxID=256323 RepID=UPI003567F532
KKGSQQEAEDQHQKINQAKYDKGKVYVMPEQSDVSHADSLCCSSEPDAAHPMQRLLLSNLSLM